MSAPDFAAILAATLADVTGEPSRMFDIECTEMLAARVPELCQTCKGYGLVAKPLRPGAQALSVTHEDCPDCPTIGQLLAIGAAVVAVLAAIWVLSSVDEPVERPPTTVASSTDMTPSTSAESTATTSEPTSRSAMVSMAKARDCCGATVNNVPPLTRIISRTCIALSQNRF